MATPLLLIYKLILVNQLFIYLERVQAQTERLPEGRCITPSCLCLDANCKQQWKVGGRGWLTKVYGCWQIRILCKAAVKPTVQIMVAQMWTRVLFLCLAFWSISATASTPEPELSGPCRYVFFFCYNIIIKNCYKLVNN